MSLDFILNSVGGIVLAIGCIAIALSFSIERDPESPPRKRTQRMTIGSILIAVGVLTLLIVQVIMPLFNPATTKSWKDSGEGETILSQNGEFLTIDEEAQTYTYLVKKGDSDQISERTVDIAKVTLINDESAGKTGTASTARFVTQKCTLVGKDNPDAHIWKSSCGTRDAIVLPVATTGAQSGSFSSNAPGSDSGDSSDPALPDGIKTSGKQLTPEEIAQLQEKGQQPNPSEQNSPHTPVEPGRESFHGGDEVAQ